MQSHGQESSGIAAFAFLRCEPLDRLHHVQTVGSRWGRQHQPADSRTLRADPKRQFEPEQRATNNVVWDGTFGLLRFLLSDKRGGTIVTVGRGRASSTVRAKDFTLKERDGDI